MVTNYYNASNRFAGPVRREPAPYSAPIERVEQAETPKPREVVEVPCEHNRKQNMVSGDGILLIGILFLLLMSGCEDKWLLIALGYLLLF